MSFTILVRWQSRQGLKRPRWFKALLRLVLG